MSVPKTPLVKAGTFTSAADAVAAERLRIMTIMECPEAANRPAAAKQLALYSDMNPQVAKEMLSRLPEEGPANSMAASFLSLMDRSTDALTIPSDLAANSLIVGGGKEARLAEIKEAARAHNVAHGYVAPDRR